MRQSRAFLVVAADPERLFLISNTLHRKFPNSVVQTCRDSEAAIEVAKSQKLDAIVAHHSTDLDEIPLLELLLAVTRVPIVVVSNYHNRERALAAGASAYLHPDEWLLIGTVVGNSIGASPA